MPNNMTVITGPQTMDYGVSVAPSSRSTYGAISDEPTINLKQPIEAKKEPFIGGAGVKHLGSQLIFPLQHPHLALDRCTYPARHPLMAFKRYSTWSEPYNSGMSFASSAASIAGSAALQRLWTIHNQ